MISADIIFRHVIERTATVDPNLELENLLTSGLPLHKVGYRLRQTARKAVRAGDVPGMRAVAKVIISELLRRGDLLRVAVDQETPSTFDSTEIFARLFDLDHMLEAMKVAQDLQVGDPRSGETGVILESILTLLEKFTPHFGLHILLFEETDLSETLSRVFCLGPKSNYPSWLDERKPGQSSCIPSVASLPFNLVEGITVDSEFSSAVAIPLYEPSGNFADFNEAREVGLLFLLARENWPQETALRLGSKLSRFVTHRWFVHREVNNKIHIDALTGLFNRGFFNGHFPLLLERAKRNQTPLTLIIADIDLFKSINTDYGLLVGDKVLQMVARRLQEEVRRVDVVCRRGGEEFAIILPETDFEAATEVITRLLNAPFFLRTEYKGKPIQVSVSFSFGVAIFPETGTVSEQLHFQAESCMFLSKDRGRNMCHFHRKNGDHLMVKPL